MAAGYPPVVRVFPDRAALAQGAAAEVARIVSDAVAARGRAAVALAGGTTPRETYEVLAHPPWRDRVPWAALDVFFGDERWVPSSDPRSNLRMARESLLNHVPVDPAHVHSPRTELSDLAEVAADYAQQIIAHVPPGPSGWPRFDLVLLGLGADGHTASLFPGDPALEETRVAVAPVPRAPDGLPRITLTLPAINAARGVLFLVAGADKSAALQRVLQRGESMPARLVRGPESVEWLLDREAAGTLSNGELTG
jgi:6-phosphogluconolactonase